MMQQVNYPVDYQVLDAAGAIVKIGTCWSGELSKVVVDPQHKLKLVTPPSSAGSDIVSIGYGSARKQEYPDLAEQVDAIWKALAVLPIAQLPAETQTVMRQIQEIKDRYEKGANYVENDGTDPLVQSRFVKLEE